MTTPNKAQHTPGPWKYGKSSRHIYSSRTGGHIATIEATKLVFPSERSAPSKEQAEANARLIAAAPELLAILQRFYAATYGNTALIPQLDFEQARAAIAKAEGRAE